MLLVILVIVVVVVIAVCLANQPASSASRSSYRAKATIHDIERAAVEAMLVAEREARRAESIEGRVIKELP
jgi:hypothetical protein